MNVRKNLSKLKISDNFLMKSLHIFLEISNWNKNNKNIQKNLKKIIKEDKISSWQYIKNIPKNQKLFFLLDNQENILSFIHLTFINNNELQFSFSYTPLLHRRKGNNKTLRKYIIYKYKKYGITKFSSIPFDGANSIYLLIKLGFKKKGQKYIFKF